MQTLNTILQIYPAFSLKPVPNYVTIRDRFWFDIACVRVTSTKIRYGSFAAGGLSSIGSDGDSSGIKLKEDAG